MHHFALLRYLALSSYISFREPVSQVPIRRRKDVFAPSPVRLIICYAHGTLRAAGDVTSCTRTVTSDEYRHFGHPGFPTRHLRVWSWSLGPRAVNVLFMSTHTSTVMVTRARALRPRPSELAVKLSVCCIVIALSCGGTPADGHNRTSARSDAMMGTADSMHELSMAVAAQAVEIQSLKGLIQDLVNTLKNTSPGSDLASTNTVPPEPSSLHGEGAVRRGTSIPANWTGPLRVKVLTKVILPMSARPALL